MKRLKIKRKVRCKLRFYHDERCEPWNEKFFCEECNARLVEVNQLKSFDENGNIQLRDECARICPVCGHIRLADHIRLHIQRHQKMKREGDASLLPTFLNRRKNAVNARCRVKSLHFYVILPSQRPDVEKFISPQKHYRLKWRPACLDLEEVRRLLDAPFEVCIHNSDNCDIGLEKLLLTPEDLVEYIRSLAPEDYVRPLECDDEPGDLYCIHRELLGKDVEMYVTVQGVGQSFYFLFRFFPPYYDRT